MFVLNWLIPSYTNYKVEQKFRYFFRRLIFLFLNQGLVEEKIEHKHWGGWVKLLQ